jgi:hypothetical protein
MTLENLITAFIIAIFFGAIVVLNIPVTHTIYFNCSDINYMKNVPIEIQEECQRLTTKIIEA